MHPHSGQETPRHATLGCGLPEPKFGDSRSRGEKNFCHGNCAFIVGLSCVRCGAMWPPRLTSGFACKSLPRPGLSARTTNWHKSSTRCAAGSGPSVPLGVRLSFFNVCYAFRICVPAAGDPGFCVDEASQHKDLELLNRARLKWEEENKKTAGKNSDGLRVGFARCCKISASPTLCRCEASSQAHCGQRQWKWARSLDSRERPAERCVIKHAILSLSLFHIACAHCRLSEGLGKR